jgi:hypothetical protein
MQHYGEGGALGGDYYETREAPLQVEAKAGGERMAVIFVDGMGKSTRVAVGVPGARTPEEIAQLPTKGQAIAMHLAPAFERAARNRQKWLREREKDPEQKPKPSPMDRPTRKFLGDDG